MESGPPVWELVFTISLFISFFAVVLYSTGRILRRMGFNPGWALMIGLWPIGLLILAFIRWPALDRG